MGVPDALLTSYDKTFQRETYHPPFSLVCVAFKNNFLHVLCVGCITQAWSSSHGFGG